MLRRLGGKRTLNLLLTHTCTIEILTRGTGSGSSTGGHGGSWGDYATSQPCLLVPETQGERVEREMEGSPVVDVKILFPYTSTTSVLATAVDATAKYRIKAVEDEAGTTLEAGPLNIKGVLDPNRLRHHLEAYCVRQMKVAA